MPEPTAETKSWIDRLGAALPVALTALATALAGLSTGEMSRAMYYRSQAAQAQGKTNDQWSLAAHKRDRALVAETTAAQLRVATDSLPGKPVVEELDSISRSWKAWERREGVAPVADVKIQELLDALRDTRGSVDNFQGIPMPLLDQVIATAEAESERQNQEWSKQLETLPANPETKKGVQLAGHYELQARRYLAESVVNRGIGYLHEIRVRLTDSAADRHHRRSNFFFYAMLGAQVGATLASLALARKQGSALWFFAGLTGLVAVSFGVYVYLGM